MFTILKSKLVFDPLHVDCKMFLAVYIPPGRILRDYLLKTSTVPYDIGPISFITFTRFKIEQDGFKI